jgi:hypothetical protein
VQPLRYFRAVALRNPPSTMMAIEFACPNGHKLSSPDENGGRMAKCPRCGAATLVPKPGGSGKGVLSDAVAVSGGSGKGIGSGSGKGSGIGKEGAKSPSDLAKGASNGAGTPDSGSARAAKETSGDGATANSATKSAGAAEEQQLVFLCPNGHKLNAPKRLQGHAGKCPHCNATFRIPLIEPTTPATPESAEARANSEELIAFENRLLESSQDNGRAVEGYEMLSTVLSDAPAGGSIVGRIEPMPANAHPLARLVARLWNEREHGGIVELHLTGGALLVPEWFDAKLSLESHGLFAVQAADGSVTMTIVAWDSVQRVVVRGVIGLPDGLFE